MPFIVCYIVHETFLVEIFRRQFQRLTEISVPCSLDHGKWVTMAVIHDPWTLGMLPRLSLAGYLTDASIGRAARRKYIDCEKNVIDEEKWGYGLLDDCLSSKKKQRKKFFPILHLW